MKRSPIYALFLLLPFFLRAEEPEPEADPSELPRIPATEPNQALSTFEIKPGFELQLAAHEPDVMDPIGMCFDEDGQNVRH